MNLFPGIWNRMRGREGRDMGFAAWAMFMSLVIAACTLAYVPVHLTYAFAQSAPNASGFGGVPWGTIGSHTFSGGALPAISAGCGTGATNSGSDAAGHVLLGSATSRPCTITFAAPYAQRPSCIVTAESFTVSYGTTTTAIALTALVDSVRVNYICVARAGG